MSNADSFYCQECGYKFRSIKSAERASFGDSGCPKCGGSDIDMGPPNPYIDYSTGKPFPEKVAS